MALSLANKRTFRTLIWNHYRRHGRHALPWRENHDPYRVLVSEVMLQQTQVERVIPYFNEWMRVFPDVRSLARAPLSTVLRMWQGLGYNRRAKMIHEAANAIVQKHDGVFPKTREALEALPGVGSYTAGAVMAFAYNKDVVFVETNIRTVILHHFFATRKKKEGVVSDTDVLHILQDVLPKGRSREWYGALMDYGAHLKRAGVQLNAKSKGYTKQKRFAGSSREARGAILRALVLGARPTSFLIDLYGTTRRAQMKRQLAALLKEGLIILKNGVFRLPR